MHGCGCWSGEQAQVTGGEELKHWGGRGAHRHVRNIMVGGNRNPGEGGLESDASIINGCEEMTQRAWMTGTRTGTVNWSQARRLSEGSGSTGGRMSNDWKLVRGAEECHITCP